MPYGNADFVGNHIITSAKHSHNSKLITSLFRMRNELSVMIGFAKFILRDKSKAFAKEVFPLLDDLVYNKFGVLDFVKMKFPY